MSRLDAVEEFHKAIKEGDMTTFAKYLKEPETHTFVDDVDDNGYTALYLACCSKHEEKVALKMVQEILKLKAKVDAKGDDRETALYIASHNQLTSVVKYLMSAGAKVNEINGSTGDTALHAAAKFGYVDVATILINEGNANINCRNSNMETPLFVSCKAGRHDVAFLLLSKDANKNLGDADGKNPLYIASEKGHKGCVSLLKVEKKEYLKDMKSQADVEVKMTPASINDPKALEKRVEKAKARDEEELKAEAEKPKPAMIKIADVEPKQQEELTHDPLTGKKLPPPWKSVVGATPAPVIPEGVVKPLKEERYGGTLRNVGTGTGQKIKQRTSIVDMLGQDDALIFSTNNATIAGDGRKAEDALKKSTSTTTTS